MTSTQKTPRAEFLWANAHMKKKTLLYLTSTQKTLWAEFLWARRLHKKKNPGSHDINTEDSMGRIPMGETLTWRKSTTLLTSTQKTLWASFLRARRLHKKKNPGSHDINTEDSMGRIPMGETLTWRKSLTLMTLTQKTQWAEFLWAKRSLEENPTALLTSARKTPWAEFLWANAHMKKNHGSTDVNTEDTMGRILMGQTLVQNLMGHLIGNS